MAGAGELMMLLGSWLMTFSIPPDEHSDFKALCPHSCCPLTPFHPRFLGRGLHIHCLLETLWPCLGLSLSWMNLCLGETSSPVPGQYQGILSAPTWGLGWWSQLHPPCQVGQVPPPHSDLWQKARQQVMVSRFLEEIRRATGCCWEGCDRRHCHQGHHLGG